jgi:glucose dehydrogenase
MRIGASIRGCMLLLLTSCALAQPAEESGDWTMAARDFANTRYSPLDQITTDNVKSLKVAWRFDTGVNRGQDAAPLIVGKTMYVVTPFPNYLFAFDLENPGPNGNVKWKYDPKAVPAAKGVACCDYVNRGAGDRRGCRVLRHNDGGV